MTCDCLHYLLLLCAVTHQTLSYLTTHPTTKNKKSIFMLSTDGFRGKILQEKFYVISFSETQTPCAVNHSTDPGVSLTKTPTNTYSLTVNRDDAPDNIFLIKGPNWIVNSTNNTDRVCKCIRSSTNPEYLNITCLNPLATCTQSDKNKNNKPVKQTEDLNITCLNPLATCTQGKYQQNICTNRENINSIEINNTAVNCIKCGKPTKESHAISPNISAEFNQTNTDAVMAVKAMGKLSNIVQQMENLTDVSVSMGSVQGVLRKFGSQEELEAISFIYSSNTGITLLGDPDELQNYPVTVTVPQEASQRAVNQSQGGNAFLAVFRFPNMTKDGNNSEVLNGDVYAIEMGTSISNLTDCIQLTFRYEQDKTPVCHSWNGSGNKPVWTTEGCKTTEAKNTVTCSCCHLTFFAVLMSAAEDPIPHQDLMTLSFITSIGCGLSMFFLGIGLFMHFLLRKAKASNSVYVLINLFVALFLLNLAFLSNEHVARMQSQNACRVMAGFMHYCMLASFTWFAVEAFHLCLQISKQTVSIEHYIMKISVAGWIPPALIVCVIYIFGKYGQQSDSNGRGPMCWIVDPTVHYVVNIGYYCFVFIFTFSTFIVVLRWLWILSRWKTEKMKCSGTRTSDITTIMGLCCLLGLTWSVSFFSFGALRVPSYYIFTILNSFQGFFLFIYYMKASSLFGDPGPSETSEATDVTKIENPFAN